MSNFTLAEPRCTSEYYVYYSSDDQDIIEAVNLAQKTFGLLCCYCCALTWTVFDHVLTFHDEIIYVWKRPVRAGSVLFYIVRYLGIVSLLAGIAIVLLPERKNTPYDLGIDCAPGGNCISPPIYSQPNALVSEEIVFKSVPALQFSVFWVVEVILQTRIFALYGSKRLAIINGLVFFLAIVTMFGFWFAAYAFRTGLPQLGATSSYTAFYWVPGIVFELWLAALAFKKLKPQVLKHDLLSVMVHDSIRYFLLIAIVMVAHVVASAKGLGLYVVPFVIAGQTIGGSRLVLHLRRAYFRSHDFEASKPGGLSFAVRQTTGIPVPRSRFADETFYVQDSPADEEFVEEAL